MLFSYAVFAQEYQILGSVQLENGEKLANISVILFENEKLLKAEITSTNGSFIFKNVKPSNYQIKVSFIGYEDNFIKDITVSNQDISLPIITLKETTTSLKELVIKKEKPLVQVLADKTVFNVENTINATGTSGFELLRKAPGVIVDNNDNLIVEGKQGVLIYIDGKQSFLSGTDLVNYLKTIQASDIESIEIITQPSSKFDAAGNGGIINIKFKKNKNIGTNGTATTGFNVGKFGTSTSSISFNNRNKKSNIYGNYSNRYGRNFGFINLYRQQSGTLFSSESESVYESNANNIKLGYDYYANAKNTFGLIVSGNFNKALNDGSTRTPIKSIGATVNDSILLARSEGRNKTYNLYSNLNYKYQDTTGVSLTLDFDYGKFASDRTNFQPNFYFDPTETSILSTVINQQNTPITINIFALKSDYEQRLWKGKLGLGFKSSLVKTDNVFDVFNFIENQPVFNPNVSNAFQFDENINALYFNYNKSIKKISFQMGLRMEHTHSRGKLNSLQANNNQVVTRDYVDWFPSGGITYQHNTTNSFALLYSRRIERPSYQALNPFEFQIDELSFQKGNPFLQPQYTDNIKLSHTYKYSLTTTLSYSFVRDFFAQVTEALGDTRNFLISRNVANQEITNLGVSYPFKVNNWWNVYLSVNAFYSRYIPTNPSFTALSQETVSLYGQNNFTLPKDIMMEVSGWFSSPSVWGGTYRTKSLGSLDIAFQKKFLNNKLTARIAFSDILFTSPWNGSATFPNLIIQGDGGSDSRQVRFNLSYNFGRDEIKKARNRNTGLEDEKNRIGN